MIRLYFDGSCEPRNPGGTATWGYVVYDERDKEITKGRGVVGHGQGMTSNVAEYAGLIAAVEWAKANRPSDFWLIRGDSMLVVNMANGSWGHDPKNPRHRKAPHLRELLDKVQEMLKDFPHEIGWIPREKNGIADYQSKLAYYEYKDGKSK